MRGEEKGNRKRTQEKGQERVQDMKSKGEHGYGKVREHSLEFCKARKVWTNKRPLESFVHLHVTFQETSTIWYRQKQVENRCNQEVKTTTDGAFEDLNISVVIKPTAPILILHLCARHYSQTSHVLPHLILTLNTISQILLLLVFYRRENQVQISKPSEPGL